MKYIHCSEPWHNLLTQSYVLNSLVLEKFTHAHKEDSSLLVEIDYMYDSLSQNVLCQLLKHNYDHFSKYITNEHLNISSKKRIHVTLPHLFADTVDFNSYSEWYRDTLVVASLDDFEQYLRDDRVSINAWAILLKHNLEKYAERARQYIVDCEVHPTSVRFLMRTAPGFCKYVNDDFIRDCKLSAKEWVLFLSRNPCAGEYFDAKIADQLSHGLVMEILSGKSTNSKQLSNALKKISDIYDINDSSTNYI